MYDKMHGMGRIIIEDGRITEGRWVGGKIRGETTILYTNGDIFQGEVIDNEMQGEGKDSNSLLTKHTDFKFRCVYMERWD